MTAKSINNLFSFENISRFRSELMGYATIGVLIGHIIVFGHLKENGIVSVLSWLSGLVHTSGFLFLSGFGLYYSLNKNNCFKDFYKRRLFRFLLPFLMIAIPYFVVVTVNKHESIWYYLSCITTIEFWINGNYHGMWYIAVSLALYALFPPLFNWLSMSNERRFVLKNVVLIVLSLCVNFLIESLCAEYWDKVGIGVSRVPYFFLGTLIAHYTKCNGKSGQMNLFVVLVLLYVLTGILSIHSTIAGMFSLLLFILFISFVFSYLSNYRIGLKISDLFRWFGKYSFELYILHLYFWFIIKHGLNLGQWRTIVVACIMAILFCVPIHRLTTKICDCIKLKLNIRQ